MRVPGLLCVFVCVSRLVFVCQFVSVVASAGGKVCTRGGDFRRQQVCMEKVRGKNEIIFILKGVLPKISLFSAGIRVKSRNGGLFYTYPCGGCPIEVVFQTSGVLPLRSIGAREGCGGSYPQVPCRGGPCSQQDTVGSPRPN